MVGISPLANLCYSGNMRGFAVGVVEQHHVTNNHVVTHDVPSLIVPYSVPMCGTIGNQLFPRIDMGLALHQPIFYHEAPSKDIAINLIHQASSVLVYDILDSKASMLVFCDWVCNPAAFTIAVIPPVRPKLEVTMKE